MLTYTPEAEARRVEIRAWLKENLPSKWFDKSYEMSTAERKAFNDTWPDKLFAGGWICATWPKEYGGKGLSTLEGVVLAEAALPAAHRRALQVLLKSGNPALS